MIESSTTRKMASVEGHPWINGLYQIVPLAIGALLFLNPCPFFFSIKEIFFYLPAAFFIISLIFHRPRVILQTPLALPLLYFTAWVAIGLPMALDPRGSLHDFGSHWMRYLVFYYLLVTFFGTSRRLEFVGRTLLVSGLLFSLGIWFWWYVIEAQPLTTRLGVSWTRLATALNGFTTVLAMILAFHYAAVSQRKLWRWAFSLSGVAALLVSLMSQSRSTLLGLIAAVLVMLFNRRRLLVLAMLAIAVFLAVMPIRCRLFTPLSDENYSVRTGHLLFFAEVLKDHPLMGTGFSLDTFRNPQHLDPRKYLQRLPQQYRNPPHPYYWPHNVLLDVAARTGLVGGILFMLIAAQAFRVSIGLMRHGRTVYVRTWAQCLLAALAMFYTKALFEPVATHYADTILFTLLAMITIVWSLDRRLPVDIVLARHSWPCLDGDAEPTGGLAIQR